MNYSFFPDIGQLIKNHKSCDAKRTETKKADDVGDYGGLHKYVHGFLSDENEKFLHAIDDIDGMDKLFRKNGEVATDYGGPHYRIEGLHEIDGEFVLLAMDKKGGSMAFYRKDGTALQSYNGEHHSICKFFDINGERILKVQHDKGGPYQFLRKDGTMVFGKAWADVREVVEIEGKKFLQATDRVGGWFFNVSVEGEIINNDEEMFYYNYLSPFGIAGEGLKIFHLVERFCDGGWKEQKEVNSKLCETIKTIYSLHLGNPEKQKEELLIAFSQLEHMLTEHPEKFMNAMGCMR